MNQEKIDAIVDACVQREIQAAFSVFQSNLITDGSPGAQKALERAVSRVTNSSAVLRNALMGTVV